jgi:hypothetical protein
MNLGMRKILENRHVLWNWEGSPDNPSLVRYHFVIGSDKRRVGIINKILDDSQSQVAVSYHFDLIREISGGVSGRKMNYRLRSYDSEMNPGLLNFKNINPIVRKDEYLYERQIGSIEDYVERLYNGDK